jgi:hypothetical protein
VTFAVVPIRAGAFTIDIAAFRDPDGNPWTGTVHGTISGDTITLEIHATGPVEGMTCDSGAQTYTLRPGL